MLLIIIVAAFLNVVSSGTANASEVSKSTRGIQINKVNAKGEGELYGELHALVIGINKYNDATIPTLQYARNDSSAIANKLLKLGFMRKNIIKVEGRDATKENILNLIKYKLNSTTTRNDGLFVFFAGHGMYAKVKNHSGEFIEQGYLLPVDAKIDRIASTGISMQTLVSMLSALTFKHVLLTIDACYSGFAFNRSTSTEGLIEKLASKRSRYIITAGGRNEQALEAAGHGLFTERLLEGLNGLADINLDGYVTSSELGIYLRSSVSNLSNNKQTPIFGTIEGEGEFIFRVANNRADYQKKMRVNLVNQRLYQRAYMKGLIFFKKGDMKNAKLFFQKALSFRPHDYWSMQKIKFITAYKPYKSIIKVSDGSTMFLIKGDSFIMGEGTHGSTNEKPRRRVFVNSYYMSKYEVTIEKYKLFLNNSQHKSIPLYFDIQQEGESSKLPVQGVSWGDANSYCRYYAGSLPSEKQWEYAARGGDGRTFVMGMSHANNEISNWYKDEKFRNVAPVGSYKNDRSTFGIFDLEGNVREWVDDVDSGYLLQEIPFDSLGHQFKVIRGGGYKTKSVNKLRVAVRAFRQSTSKYIGIGFRCVKTPTVHDYQ